MQAWADWKVLAGLCICALVWFKDYGSTLFAVYGVLLLLDTTMRWYHARNLRPVEPRDGEFAVVTGASSGIGRELCIALAERNFNIVAVARSKDKLEALATEIKRRFKVDARAVATDLSTPAGVDVLTNRLGADKLTVSILVNNAGFARKSLFHKTEEKTISQMIGLNSTTVTLLTRRILPDMISRGRGRVLVNSSIVGGAPQATQAVYAATKAYLSSLCSSLSYELRNTGVSITCLEPGATITGFAQVSNLTDANIFRIPRFFGVQSAARDVALAAVDATLAGAPRLSVGWFSHLSVFAAWLAPSRLIAWIAVIFWADPRDIWSLLV